MNSLYIICAALTAVVITLTIRLLRARKNEASARATLAAVLEREERLQASEQQLRAAAAARDEKINQLGNELAAAKALLEASAQQREKQKEELGKMQESFRHEFRNLAGEMLEQRSAQFKQQNRESMEALLKPFRENITQFRERVESIYSEENTNRGALQNEIKRLMELNNRVTEETNNLTRALKGNSKVQGDWGEMVLETILESSNLIAGIHYTTQENFKTEEGANVRPDVVLNLPGEKRIVIDSKVSLTAFVNHCEAEDEPTRKLALDAHVRSVRSHVAELSAKRYQELLDSPDFVIMFVPNEPAFLAAMQCDNSIWSDAYNKKVIVSSPTNLFALLKLVDDLWKRDSQNRNAMDIADAGAKLYEKFVGFVQNLEAVGKNLDKAAQSYEAAMKQLSTGRGSLVTQAENMRKLGIKASKSLPAGYFAEAEQESFTDPENPGN